MTHPTIRHLSDHAAGASSSGMRLIVATHLRLCPPCRSKLSRLELIGGALLASEPVPSTIAPPDLRATLSRLDAGPCDGGEPQLPLQVQRALEGRAEGLRWRRLIPGLWDIRLPGDPDEDVRLLRARPGTAIFPHTHEGEEATLVLRGQIRDGERVFGRGELSLCGPDDNHRPEAVGEEDCLCLFVIGGRMRFTGPMGPLLNLLPQ